MRRNPELEAALDELAKHGIVDVTRSGRKHVKLAFVHAGEAKLIVVAGTGSDRRAVRNVRADVRHVLSVERVVVKSKRPRKQRNRVERKAPPTITCGKDPWAQYRADLEEEISCTHQFGKGLGNSVAASCRRIRSAGHAAAQRIGEYAR